MKPVSEIKSIIKNSTGTEAYHKFSLIPGYPVITDGVLALAEAAGCFWLLDAIGSYQNNHKLNREFQVWKLGVDEESSSAVLRGYNDTNELVITQEIEFTDFPLDTVTIYCIDGVILLPTEY